MATVMIADDSLVIRRTLKKILTKAGHTVVFEAENGLQAIEGYRRHQPDVVTMDINMPMMDGIDAVDRIVADYSDARIVMISAVEEKEKVFEALQRGAKNYILKPFNEISVIRILALVTGEEEPDPGAIRRDPR